MLGPVCTVRGTLLSAMNDQDRFILLASLWIVYTIALLLIVWIALVGGRALRRALFTTAMSGPERSFFGNSADSLDITKLCKQYGPVFQVPTGAFSKNLVVCDPAAIGGRSLLRPWYGYSPD
jgi:hypothetical protein